MVRLFRARVLVNHHGVMIHSAKRTLLRANSLFLKVD
jgi:hypothetical protein